MGNRATLEAYLLMRRACLIQEFRWIEKMLGVRYPVRIETHTSKDAKDAAALEIKGEDGVD